MPVEMEVTKSLKRPQVMPVKMEVINPLKQEFRDFNYERFQAKVSVSDNRKLVEKARKLFSFTKRTVENKYLSIALFLFIIIILYFLNVGAKSILPFKLG